MRSEATQTPWLSIVLPIHNGERWIERTLESLAETQGKGVEIVVIDTSATSGTMDKMMRFAERLTIRVVDACGREGCYAKTNWGVENAAGEYVAWLCQDDLWLAGRLTAIRRWVAQAPDAALHLAPSLVIDRNGKSLGTWRCPLPTSNVPLSSELLLARLLVQNFVGVPSPVIRRGDWLACGGIDTSLWYTGDWDMWLKLSQRGLVYYHDEVTAAFRIHGNSATSIGSQARGDLLDQQLRVLNRHCNDLTPTQTARIRPLADASVVINAALASAANGNLKSLAQVLMTLVRLGPVGLWRYIHYSRIVDRVLPRVRAKLAGVL